MPALMALVGGLKPPQKKMFYINIQIIYCNSGEAAWFKIIFYRIIGQ
jgi:hypothetical protein